jgi:hypothetical protein
VIAGAGYPVRTHGSRWNPGRNFDAGNCYEMQAPTRALDAFRVVIDGDCFLVSRFADAAAARDYAATEPHCTLPAGEIVLRSDPPRAVPGSLPDRELRHPRRRGEVVPTARGREVPPAVR